MNPPLARKLVLLTKPKMILDPFCGGGAVIVESMLNGTPAVGVDINPLAVIVSKAKTTYIEKAELVSEQNNIIEYVKKHPNDCIEFPKSYMINYWYKPYMLNPLSALANAVSGIQQEK